MREQYMWHFVCLSTDGAFLIIWFIAINNNKIIIRIYIIYDSNKVIFFYLGKLDPMFRYAENCKNYLCCLYVYKCKSKSATIIFNN